MSKDNNMNGGGHNSEYLLVCSLEWVSKYFPFLLQPKNNIKYLYDKLTMQKTNESAYAFLVSGNPMFEYSTYRFGGKNCSTLGVRRECNLE